MLLKEYQESLRSIKELRETAPEEDQKIYAGMVSNLEYVVKWLRDDQQPAPKKSGSVTWDPEWEEFSENHTDPWSMSVFEEIDRKIDAERKMQHA